MCVPRIGFVFSLMILFDFRTEEDRLVQMFVTDGLTTAIQEGQIGGLKRELERLRDMKREEQQKEYTISSPAWGELEKRDIIIKTTNNND